MNEISKTENPVRVGVVGVGYFGRLHAMKYHGLADARLIGVVDQNAERASEVGRQLSISHYGDIDALLDQVDAVSISTPATHHYALARRFLEAGVHVLVEKPLATSLADADALIALAAEKNLILQVGHQERYVFARFDAENLARHPLAITCRRAGPFTGRGLDCNVVLDLMIHDLDLAHRLMDFEPQAITARGRCVHGDLEDEVTVRIDCGQGRTLDLFASRVGDHLERFIRVETPQHGFEIDFTNRTFKIEPGRAHDHVDDEPEKIALPSPPVLEHQDPLGEEIASFVASVRSGKMPLVSGRDGRRALATALMINATLAAARP